MFKIKQFISFFVILLYNLNIIKNMKKILLALSILLTGLFFYNTKPVTATINTITNSVDTVFTCKGYTSHYSFKFKNPIMVNYKLYKGGGSCLRSGYYFKNDNLGHRTATAADYAHNGYDEGHLANAEDFAYNCTLEEMTFRYWNCCPQTPQLNRGIWKVNETEIRKISQTDSLLVLCGSFYNKRYIGNGVFIPDTCWKVVYSLSKKTVIMSNVFTNTANPVMTSIDFHTLNALLIKRYNVNLTTYLK